MRTADFFQFQLNSSFMFGRTLFEYCVRKDTLHNVRKDTLHNVRKDTFQNMKTKMFYINSHLLTLKCSEYLHLVKTNPQIYLALKLVHGKGVKNNDRQRGQNNMDFNIDKGSLETIQDFLIKLDIKPLMYLENKHLKLV